MNNFELESFRAAYIVVETCYSFILVLWALRFVAYLQRLFANEVSYILLTG